MEHSECVRNGDVHRDLVITGVATELKHFPAKHEARLHEHIDLEAIQLLDNSSTRRLKRTNPLSWYSGEI